MREDPLYIGPQDGARPSRAEWCVSRHVRYARNAFKFTFDPFFHFKINIRYFVKAYDGGRPHQRRCFEVGLSHTSIADISRLN